MYKEMYTRTWEIHQGPDRRHMKIIEMLETRSTAETELRWLLESVSNGQESLEVGKTNIDRWFGGSRIKRSTLSVGEPRTWGRS
jgi:hypothetical protein